MVVPNNDPWVLTVGFLQIRVTAVLGVALPVILERDNFLFRRWNAANGRSVAILFIAVLVDVVAEVRNKVQIGPAGNLPIGVEEAVGVIRTGNNGETQTVQGADGERLRAADWRLRTFRRKLVVVCFARIQPRDVDLHRAVIAGVCIGDAALLDLPHRRIFSDRPFDDR